MSNTLPKNAVHFNARIATHRVADSLPETYSTSFTRRSNVQAELKVDDAFVRQHAPGFDGRERPFVLLPAEHQGQVTWYRHELQYRGPSLAGYYASRAVDAYELPAVNDVDRKAVEKYGVALGMDTNVGTLWAQKPGDNFTARDDSTSNLWK